jgi:glutathione S-transferase
LGKSPVVTIKAPGAAKPLVLAESGAIVEYLVEHFGDVRPGLVPQRYTPGCEGKVGGETEEWMRYRYFMHYTEGSLMPFLVMTLVNDCKSFISEDVANTDIDSYSQCSAILCPTDH